MAAGWIALGMGVVQEIRSAVGSGGNGVTVTCPAVRYHVGDGHEPNVVSAPETTFPAVVVNVAAMDHEQPNPGSFPAPIAGCWALISMTGAFAQGGEHPPVLSNVQMSCSEQTGNWGTGNSESEVLFTADAMPDAVGPSAEDPHIEFRCRTELKIPVYDNVIVHFQLWVNSFGFLSFGTPQFEYGKCDVYQDATYLMVNYDVSRHGGAAH